MTIEIQLTKGYVAVIDDEDADLAQYKWQAHWTNLGNRTIYASRKEYHSNGKSVTIYLHRIILSRILQRELIKSDKVDHVNLNGIDNRRQNLRLATHQENIRNCGIRRNNTSGHTGVTWAKREQKWCAYISINGKQIHLGYHVHFDDAKNAHDEAARLHFGEFARLT